MPQFFYRSDLRKITRAAGIPIEYYHINIAILGSIEPLLFPVM